ncbi:Rossman fold protein, TIGR00730 family [Virgibacillus phasianinus]|uniref:Cytokinin riboside 5'-monophosphate phosphoribohydrolase n=1 Tax=Virgibacillus phasianinus TaxID=2017483 RepID=A0A220U2N3_9BACI|nr:TIGR00730 family Rossman fold protein [Virgibacillus phasianinus]ASK62350.1 Rossman fold protein, TIGR00730 family [Virgibacillus phasianinus]
MKRLAVFCGSSDGASKAYKEGAIQLGEELAKREITLVYGGASVGIMGAVANAVLENGGKVIGVIPQMLEDREISHPNLTELHVVQSMHERKAKMADLADGFIALPGGPGTLEEFIEVFTWAQLGVHQKPCGLLNINHYYEPLVSLFNHMADQQFLHEEYRSMALVDSCPSQLIEQFYAYQPPAIKTYIKKDQT